MSRTTYRTRLLMIFWKLAYAVIDQIYDISVVVFLVKEGRLVLASLILLVDLVPGFLIMWNKFNINQRKCSGSIFLFICHPVNMIVWPLFVAWKPTDQNKQCLEVDLVSLNFQFLSAAIGQRPRNYWSCCCSCSSPFGSFPH